MEQHPHPNLAVCEEELIRMIIKRKCKLKCSISKTSKQRITFKYFMPFPTLSHWKPLIKHLYFFICLVSPSSVVCNQRDGVHVGSRDWASSQSASNKLLTAISPCVSQLFYLGSSVMFLEFGSSSERSQRICFPLKEASRGLWESLTNLLLKRPTFKAASWSWRI